MKLKWTVRIPLMSSMNIQLKIFAFLCLDKSVWVICGHNTISHGRSTPHCVENRQTWLVNLTWLSFILGSNMKRTCNIIRPAQSDSFSNGLSWSNKIKYFQKWLLWAGIALHQFVYFLKLRLSVSLASMEIWTEGRLTLFLPTKHYSLYP